MGELRRYEEVQPRGVGEGRPPIRERLQGRAGAAAEGGGRGQGGHRGRESRKEEARLKEGQKEEQEGGRVERRGQRPEQDRRLQGLSISPRPRMRP